MRDNFDPMTMVPEDDEEAKIALQRNDDILTTSLRGIYECRRQQGDSVLAALQVALEAHIEAYEATKA